MMGGGRDLVLDFELDLLLLALPSTLTSRHAQLFHFLSLGGLW